MSLSTQKIGWFSRPFGCSKPSGRDLNAEDVLSWRSEANPSLAKRTTNGTYAGLGLFTAGLLSGLYGLFKDNSLVKTLSALVGVGGIITAIVGAISKISDSNINVWKPAKVDVECIADTNILKKPVKLVFSQHETGHDADRVNRQISEILSGIDSQRPVVIWFERTTLDFSSAKPAIYTPHGLRQALQDMLEVDIDKQSVVRELTTQLPDNKFIDDIKTIYEERKKSDLTIDEFSENPQNEFMKSVVDNLNVHRKQGRKIRFEVEDHSFEMLQSYLAYNAFHCEKIQDSISAGNKNEAISNLKRGYEALNNYFECGDGRLMKRVQESYKQTPEAVHIVIRGNAHTNMSVSCVENEGLGYEAFQCTETLGFDQALYNYLLDNISPTVQLGFEFDIGRRNLLAVVLTYAARDMKTRNQLTQPLMTIIKETPIEVLNSWIDSSNDSNTTDIGLIGQYALKHLNDNKSKLSANAQSALEAVLLKVH